MILIQPWEFDFKMWLQKKGPLRFPLVPPIIPTNLVLRAKKNVNIGNKISKCLPDFDCTLYLFSRQVSRNSQCSGIKHLQSEGTNSLKTYLFVKSDLRACWPLLQCLDVCWQETAPLAFSVFPCPGFSFYNCWLLISPRSLINHVKRPISKKTVHPSTLMLSHPSQK